jgi:hypothetical protein
MEDLIREGGGCKYMRVLSINDVYGKFMLVKKFCLGLRIELYLHFAFSYHYASETCLYGRNFMNGVCWEI